MDTPFQKLVNTLEPDRVIPYKRIGTRDLYLHIFYPPDYSPKNRYPCFAFAHGGGWVKNTPRVAYPYVQLMSLRGWIGVSIEYRLLQDSLSPANAVSDCVCDGRSALRYLRSHADELSIIPEAITMGGSSAGGHVAVGSAIFDQVNDEQDNLSISPQPQALVLFNPVIDTSPEGYGSEKIGDGWRSLSPLHNVRHGVPPTILFHGTADPTTPFAGAEAFHRAMLAAGNICQFHPHEGGVHGYIRDPELFEPAINAVSDFLRRQGMGQSRSSNI